MTFAILKYIDIGSVQKSKGITTKRNGIQVKRKFIVLKTTCPPETVL